jgi:hypothetical protein
MKERWPMKASKGLVQVNPPERGAIKPLTVTFQTGSVVSGISQSKLWKLAKDGAIRVVRVGKRTLIVYATLEDFVLGGAEKAPRPTPNRWADKAASETSPEAA